MKVKICGLTNLDDAQTAVAYERTRSLFMPIIIHLTTNSAAVLLLYLSLALLELFPALQ